MEIKTIQDLIKYGVEVYNDDSFDDDAVSFRDDYSGRGMYNRECIAISGKLSHCEMAIAEMVKLCHELEMENNLPFEFDTAIDELITNRSYDNMGRGVVMYWARLKKVTEVA
jgi:hypothetical protein